MKGRIVLFNCCVVLSALLTGCQFVSNIGREEKQREVVTEVAEETEPVTVTVEVESEEVKQDKEAAVGLGTVQEYAQCLYCAHWFSTGDDGNGTPYNRHLEEEQETDSAHGLTEAELAECSECGNWYPTGNIFRNHVCEGR